MAPNNPRSRKALAHNAREKKIAVTHELKQLEHIKGNVDAALNGRFMPDTWLIRQPDCQPLIFNIQPDLESNDPQPAFVLERSVASTSRPPLLEGINNGSDVSTKGLGNWIGSDNHTREFPLQSPTQIINNLIYTVQYIKHGIILMDDYCKRQETSFAI